MPDLERPGPAGLAEQSRSRNLNRMDSDPAALEQSESAAQPAAAPAAAPTAAMPATILFQPSGRRRRAAGAGPH